MPVLLLGGALAGCNGADDGSGERRTIAILRSVEGIAAESELLGGLAEGEYGADRIMVLGADRSEAQPDADAAEAAAARMVEDGAEVLIALSTTTALAAAKVTKDVPVLFISTHPLATGLVEDERSPKGNLTGVAYRVPADRTLALGREVLGEMDAVGCLFGKGDPAAHPPQKDLRRGGEALDVSVRCAGYDGPAGVRAAVAEMVDAGVDAIVVINSPATVRAYPELAAALAGTDLPVFGNTPTEFALLTLVPDSGPLYRQLGRQAARLLDGVAVSDVPVEDPASYRLEVNLEAAGRLGVTVPEAVLERADEVVGKDLNDR